MTGDDRFAGRAMRAGLFLAAGLLMLVSVALIVLNRFDLRQVPEVWIAVPAIAAQVACICGLIALRPLLRRAVVLSRLGLGFAVAAAAIIAAGGVWIAVTNGAAAGSGPGIYLLAFAYIVSICPAFVLFAAATFRVQGAGSPVGWLLLAPAVLWTLLVVAAVVVGPQVALSLDWMTNAAIAMALLAVGGIVSRPTAGGRP